MKPLCVVLAPSGLKSGNGGPIDFDAVYADLIQPAVSDAGLDPLRADEEQAGGLLQKPMLERLILCEYAVVDLTTANAEVFYALGLRHAVKPKSTVLIVAANRGSTAFDLSSLRALSYTLAPDGRPAHAADDRAALVARLEAAQRGTADSPVYQIVDGFRDIQRLKTDVFRDRVEYSRQLKERLAAARAAGIDAVRAIERELAAAPTGLHEVEAGVLIDLLLSYRSVKGWTEMVALVPRMPPPLAAAPLVQEQLAFALNRAGESDRAERVLREVIALRGPSSETCGILGRVYKDRYDAALKRGEAAAARGLLAKAIETYLEGFESDWRDAYPGINAVTLMELADPPDPRRLRLIPVVAYAVERRIAAGTPDYWDYATRLELAVLAKDQDAAAAALGAALAAVRESWEAESTARNLQLVRDARAKRGEHVQWAAEIENELARRAFSSASAAKK